MEIEKVAKILNYTDAMRSKIKDEGLEMVLDIDGYIVVNTEDAEEVLDSSEFQTIDYNPAYIGAPRPRRPRS